MLKTTPVSWFCPVTGKLRPATETDCEIVFESDNTFDWIPNIVYVWPSTPLRHIWAVFKLFRTRSNLFLENLDVNQKFILLWLELMSHPDTFQTLLRFNFICNFWNFCSNWWNTVFRCQIRHLTLLPGKLKMSLVGTLKLIISPFN